MLKIAVFGFYNQDQSRTPPPHQTGRLLSPINTGDFMRIAWELEPPESRVGGSPEGLGFVKLTHLTNQPVYIQPISDRMAPGAGLFNCSGYIAIIDSVKIFAPRTIQNTLRRLSSLNPDAYLMIAAARQNEPDALSSQEIREVLGLSAALPIYPYSPEEPGTVKRLLRRLVRYIESPVCRPLPVFAGERAVTPPANSAKPEADSKPRARPVVPHIHGLDHVAVTVSDLERSLEFYRGLLGFRVLGYLDFPGDALGFSIAYLDTGRGVLELFSYAQGMTQPSGWSDDDTQVGIRHFALRVTGLDTIAGQLMAAGVPFTIKPMDAAGGVRIAFFTDPDGTLIELVEGDLVYSRR